jgi:hypothetical protein
MVEVLSERNKKIVPLVRIELTSFPFGQAGRKLPVFARQRVEWITSPFGLVESFLICLSLQDSG